MRKNIGLTFIELLITLAIIGILATIAYPQYQQYVTRTYRIRAIQHVLILSKALNSYYRQHHSYLDAKITNLATTDILSDKHYRYEIRKLTAETYQLIAVPQEPQITRDQHCGKLSINQLGEKSISGNARLHNCWP